MKAEDFDLVFINSVQMVSYDLNTGTEERLPRMIYPRENFTTILVGKFIYVFGGRSDYFPSFGTLCER